MAEVIAVKKTAKKGQAEITIIEEKLCAVHGILPIEIAGSLSNRFDKILDDMNKIRSELAYVQKIENKDDRIKKIADIKNRLAKKAADRQNKIGEWHKRVNNYILTTYGEGNSDANGLITSYGKEGRIEVMKNRHLKKLW